MAKKKLPKSMALRLKMIGVIIAICSIIFLPTSLIFFVGLMPTIAAALVDNSKGRYLTMSVGVLNLAGCFPFVLELWSVGHSMENSVAIIAQARTIIIIYLIAALGYVIDFSVAGIVSNVLLQRGQARMKKITKLQKELMDRWGTKVNGKIPLDEHGFPTQQND